MKETAVEWLIEQIENGKIEIIYSDKIHSIKCLPEFIKQAKEMEKKQHGETYSKGWTTRERFDDLVPDIIYPEGLDYEEKQEYAFEKYYNEHYGK